jgi:transcriptional regulator with XRE-family HTH domain
VAHGLPPSTIGGEAAAQGQWELRGFDVTQAEFARRVGISQNHLSVVERGGREIGAAIVLRIAREFRKSMEWLLTGKDD